MVFQLLGLNAARSAVARVGSGLFGNRLRSALTGTVIGQFIGIGGGGSGDDSGIPEEVLGAGAAIVAVLLVIVGVSVFDDGN